MKVVLDTNIFISGIFWKGSSNKVITNWRKGRFALVTSLEAVSEIIEIRQLWTNIQSLITLKG